MFLPHVVQADLDRTLVARWQKFYAEPADRDRRVEEGLWRRTQDPRNAADSGWRFDADARRRILHYRYEYDIIAGHLAMTNLYIFFSVSYPIIEFELVRQQLCTDLNAGGWTADSSGFLAWHRDNLRCALAEHQLHPEDIRVGRVLPDDYRSLDVMIWRDTATVDDDLRQLPWQVLAGGMRIKDRRGKPQEDHDLKRLLDFLPFQVELGCGASVEAGIPALHHLHDVYQVTDRPSGSFVLDPRRDTFLADFIAAPERIVRRLTGMFRSCLMAEPTGGHELLRRFRDAGHLVGPIITNNFDGLPLRAGLSECYVRRYDEQIPAVPFLDESRSLLVVGSHADRRRVQQRARARGMQVFFIDPEGFHESGGFVPYPLEGAQDGDVLCCRTASDGLEQLARNLGVAS